MIEQLVVIRQHGYRCIRLEGEGDVADVCRLTCLEQGIEVVEGEDMPLLRVKDLKVFIDWDEDENCG